MVHRAGCFFWGAVLQVFVYPLHAAAQDEPTYAWDGVEFGEFPDPIATESNLMIICIASGAVALLLIAVLVQILVQGSTRLPVLLLALQLVAVLVSGISTWLVSYRAAHSAITDHANSLLVFSGLTAASQITADMNNGARMVMTLFHHTTTRRFDLNAGYPTAHHVLYEVESTVGQGTSAVSVLYFGSETGRLQGIVRGLNSSGSPTAEFTLLVGISPLRCRGDSRAGYGTPESPCRNRDIELRCEDNTKVWDTCMHRACSAEGGGGCEWCLTSVSQVANSSERCAGCTPCAEWLPGSIEEFRNTPRDIIRWDLPEPAGREPGFCNERSGEDWEKGPGMRTVQGYNSDGSEGRVWVGGYAKAHGGGCSYAFDPRVRPWYSRSEGLTWSPVYSYVPVNDVVEMGITVTQAVLNPNYSGAPYIAGVPANANDSPWQGVLAADFGFNTLSAMLRRLKPTPGSNLFLSDLEGTLCAGSLPPQEMTYVHTDDSGETVFAAVNVLKPETWKRRSLASIFTAIANKYQGLAEAAKHRAVIHDSGAAIFNQPLHMVAGLVWLMAVHVPYDDLITDSQRATTVALVLAVGISFASGLLISLLVVWVIHPITVLSRQTRNVAIMRFEGLRIIPGGVASEVRHMATHFGMMVDNLVELREYMPQAVLLPGDDDGCLVSLVGVDEFQEERSGTQMDDPLSRPARSSQVPMPMPAESVRPSGDISVEDDTTFGARRSSDAQSQVTTKTDQRDADGSDHHNTKGSFCKKAHPQLTQRSVTLLALNLHDWQQVVYQQSTPVLASIYDRYLGTCLAAARRTNGVFQMTHGDRVLIGFNVPRPTRQHHSEAAVRCGLLATGKERLTDAHPQGDLLLAATAPLQLTPTMMGGCGVSPMARSSGAEDALICRTASSSVRPKIDCGISAGHCRFGVLGCTGAKMLATLGGPAAYVFVCERLARRWGVSVVADHSVHQVCATQFHAKLLDRVCFPKRGAARAVFVYEFTGVKDLPAEEWMYQMEAAAAQDMHKDFNAVMENLFDGHTDRAAMLLASSTRTHAPELDQLRAHLEASGSLESLVNRVVTFDDCGAAPQTSAAALMCSVPNEGDQREHTCEFDAQEASAISYDEPSTPVVVSS